MALLVVPLKLNSLEELKVMGFQNLIKDLKPIFQRDKRSQAAVFNARSRPFSCAYAKWLKAMVSAVSLLSKNFKRLQSPSTKHI